MQKITVHYDHEQQKVTKVDGQDFKSLEFIKAILGMAVDAMDVQMKLERTMALANAVQAEQQVRKQMYGGNGLILGEG